MRSRRWRLWALTAPCGSLPAGPTFDSYTLAGLAVVHALAAAVVRAGGRASNAPRRPSGSDGPRREGRRRLRPSNAAPAESASPRGEGPTSGGRRPGTALALAAAGPWV